MKKILGILIPLLLGIASFAQWDVNGTNLYNTNTGIV